MQATSTHRVSMTYAHQAHFWLQQCMRELQQDATSKMPLVGSLSCSLLNLVLRCDHLRCIAFGSATFINSRLSFCCAALCPLHVSPSPDMASAAYRNYRLNDFKFMETIGA